MHKTLMMIPFFMALMFMTAPTGGGGVTNCNFTNCLQVDFGQVTCSIPVNGTECSGGSKTSSFHFTFSHLPTVQLQFVTGPEETFQNNIIFSTGRQLWAAMPNAETELFGTCGVNVGCNHQLVQTQDATFECQPIVWVEVAATGNAYLTIQASPDDSPGSFVNMVAMPGGRIPINATGFQTWSLPPNGPQGLGYIIANLNQASVSFFIRVAGALGGGSSPVLGTIQLSCFSVSNQSAQLLWTGVTTSTFTWNGKMLGESVSPGVGGPAVPANLTISYVAFAKL